MPGETKVPLKDLPTADLERLRDDLAAQRTSIRLQQVAVASELELRAALAAMTPETRRVVELRLGGSIKPEGEVKS